MILAVSLVLRIYLALHGGQGFWPDEVRYQSSQYAVEGVLQGDWRTVALHLLGQADHPLFHWFGLPPAGYEKLLGPSPAFVAAYFGLFSTLAIYLVWRVAQRAGSGRREALMAAFLAACANSLFYYSRHYFPYDIALCLMLMALSHALESWSVGRSFLTGLLAGLGFLTYSGYWLLGGSVLILHGLLGDGGFRRFLPRVAAAGAGLASPLVLFIVLGRIAGYDPLAELQFNATTITQGDFHLGYRIIPAYLWHTEGALFLLWLGGAATTLVLWARDRRLSRAAWWLGGLVILTGGLVLYSDVVPKFVVYGRLVRQLVPFFCLATACAMERLMERRLISKLTLGWAAAAVVVFAAWNFAGSLRQVFPDDFRRLATAEVFKQQRSGYGVYRVVFDEYLWGVDVKTALPPHATVLRRSHPLQFRPYQYEGFSAAQRDDLNHHDVSMRLIRLTGGPDSGAMTLAHGDKLWGDYPGPVRMRLNFAFDKAGLGQPLVTAGTAQHADFLYVKSDPAGRIRFGFDHWDTGAVVSDPIAVDLAQPHELLISMGALLPAGSEILQHRPELAYLHDILLVLLDGKVVWSQWSATHAASPEIITFGANFIGGSSTAAAFAGQITRLERASLSDVVRHVGPLAGRDVAASRPASWQNAPGPVLLRCSLPDIPIGVAQPLVAAGRPGEGDLVFWIREEGERIRFGFDRQGEGAMFSEPVPAPAGTDHEIVISLGSLMPPDGNVVYSENPDYQHLRELLFASLDGRTVFLRKHQFERTVTDVAFGVNTVGSSVASAYFTGNLQSTEPAKPADVLAASVQLARMVETRAAAWQGFPGPVRLKLRFPAQMPRLPEPLIVTGVTGKGDFVYVRYEAGNKIRVGYDHWAVNGAESSPVTIDPGVEHELVISFGGLMPPADGPLYQTEPALLRLRSLLWVSLDGRTIFVTPMAVHPTKPGQIVLGVNFIGGSTTDAVFSGRITAINGVAPEEVLAQLRTNPSGSPGTPR